MNAFEWPAKGRKTMPVQPLPASMLQPVDYVDETDYEPGSADAPCGQQLEVPLPEAIDGALTDAYVAADQDLFWLAEHGELERAARKLAALRAMVEARRKPPEWARYSARCCRSPVYSTHPFTFNDGCGAGGVAATEVTG